MAEDLDLSKLANFFFELGSMRKLPRMHQQALLTQDLSDNIASHSYRVPLIAWTLARMESVDPYKTVMMALLHDVGEARSGDHNYIHKKYVRIFEEEISHEQLGKLPFKELFEFSQEYEARESKEAIVAKDADLLDQMLLLKEYAHQGNKEAAIWLSGKRNGSEGNVQLRMMKTVSAKRLGQQILDTGVSEWWLGVWTEKNR